MKNELLALGIKIFHVGWMSIGLGVVMEMIVLGLLLATGGQTTSLGFAVNVLSRVSWSVVVCTALAITTALPKAAIPASGVAGLLVAPGMTLATKVLQKMLMTALTGAAAALKIPLVLSLAAVKGVEYLVLGSLIAVLAARGHGFLAAIGVGTTVGIVFAAIVTGINVWGEVPAAALVSGFINELLFPIGCSIILFGADRLGRFMADALAGSTSQTPTPAGSK